MPSGVYDHSKTKGTNHPNWVPRETRTCACGECGETFECKVTSKQRYIHNHHRNGKTYDEIYGPNKAKEVAAKIGKRSAERSHSIETIQKIRKAAQGRKQTEESNRKRSITLTGRVFSGETIKNMSESRVRFIREHPGCMAKENNSNWRGGTSNEPYSFEFNEEFRNLIRERDNHTCQLCGKTKEQEGRNLCVHHINYNKKNDCSDKDDFTTLCDGCNGKVNGDRDYWIEFFQSRLKLSKVS